MRKFDQKQNNENATSGKEASTLKKKLKAFFTNPSKKKIDSEIDYYHQYIFPNRTKNRLRNQKSSNQTNN